VAGPGALFGQTAALRADRPKHSTIDLVEAAKLLAAADPGAVEDRDGDGLTPWHIAAAGDSRRVLKFFVESFPKPAA
jgi:hypothetical protein